MLFDPKWEVEQKTAEPWRQALLEAADIIEQRGHCKGVAEDARGRVCIIGALLHVGGNSWTGAWKVLRNEIGESIGAFNDTHTKAQVLAKLREVARS